MNLKPLTGHEREENPIWARANTLEHYLARQLDGWLGLTPSLVKPEGDPCELRLAYRSAVRLVARIECGFWSLTDDLPASLVPHWERMQTEAREAAASAAEYYEQTADMDLGSAGE
jgi:hypothetical protein